MIEIMATKIMAATKSRTWDGFTAALICALPVELHAVRVRRSYNNGGQLTTLLLRHIKYPDVSFYSRTIFHT